MVKKLDQSLSAIYATGQVKAIDANTRPQGLIFKFNNDTTFKIALRPLMIFGRSDSQTSVDVDLTSLDAVANGVSRRHMMLVQQGSRLLVQDMRSTNGTRINDKVLEQGTFHELPDNAKLQLGNLKLRVSFTYEPVISTVPISSLDDNASMSETIPTEPNIRKDAPQN